jgi:hypothetical protein
LPHLVFEIPSQHKGLLYSFRTVHEDVAIFLGCCAMWLRHTAKVSTQWSAFTPLCDGSPIPRYVIGSLVVVRDVDVVIVTSKYVSARVILPPVE